MRGLGTYTARSSFTVHEVCKRDIRRRPGFSQDSAGARRRVFERRRRFVGADDYRAGVASWTTYMCEMGGICLLPSGRRLQHRALGNARYLKTR